MKPTKVRNHQIYRASNQTINKQICAPLSKDLRKKYSRRSARIVTDDSIRIIRGEYKGLTGKVAKISTESNSIAIEGNKKEKLKGEKVDVYIHSTNTIITSLNTDDKWRIKILEKKSKGEKVDVYIHSSNVIITSLNTSDKWRIKILEKKPKSKIKSMKEEPKKKDGVKSVAKKKNNDKKDVKK